MGFGLFYFKCKTKTSSYNNGRQYPIGRVSRFLSVLITGHKVIVKQSSNDTYLLPILAQYLVAIEPDFENHINFTTEKLPNFEAVIATGSNNTARYFEYYFKGKPSIIRKTETQSPY